MTETVESLVAYCRENNRVCPMPLLWNQLWRMLPNQRRVGAGWQAPTSLILVAWHDAPAMFKMFRLAEHIEWAAEHDALDPIARFLRALREEDWLHVGE